MMNDSDLFDVDVLTYVDRQISGLESGMPYTLKQICGKKYWNKLTRNERIRAGKTVATAVSGNYLPLRFGDKTAANALTYLK